MSLARTFRGKRHRARIREVKEEGHEYGDGHVCDKASVYSDGTVFLDRCSKCGFVHHAYEG